MKLTKQQLKQIIKEELQKVLREQDQLLSENAAFFQLEKCAHAEMYAAVKKITNKCRNLMQQGGLSFEAGDSRDVLTYTIKIVPGTG